MTNSPSTESSTRLHADRAAGRDRHHRSAYRPALAGGPGGPRGGPTRPVRQQSEADGAGLPNYESSNCCFPMGNSTYTDLPAPAALAARRKMPRPSTSSCPTWSRGRCSRRGTSRRSPPMTRPVRISAPKPDRWIPEDHAYICPSDGTFSVNAGNYYTPWVKGSYAMNRGRWSLFMWGVSMYTNDPAGQYYSTCNFGGGDGMFMPISIVTIAAVTDGTSNTFFFGEQSQFLNEPPGSTFSMEHRRLLVGAWPGKVPPTGGLGYVIPSSMPRRTRRAPSTALASPASTTRPTGSPTATRRTVRASSSGSSASGAGTPAGPTSLWPTGP